MRLAVPAERRRCGDEPTGGMMVRLRFGISMSVDGFIAGPNPSEEQPLGEGGEQLHEWVVKLAAWRKPHGLEGGEVNASTDVLEESLDNIGATVMGRNMFGGGPGPWREDPGRDGGETIPPSTRRSSC
jgi:dihydrofolate reductase